ncbi:hypothetical protein [Aliivibrio sifiae]|uniref:Uncharacterized protein n=1 Tax=Aliivibrio sifiae TaxID=566293 RepID=A0A2S7X7U1_9GAMM|nr:hypothetical protein [Aliivibrio sifiae]PQJ87433.1 hypothetical protein BTO23_15075 [Aliivibrio sifiae]GLR77290.1 hypothetical protein GCM10007855_41650 [Aliivibrio sifiae]
MAIKITADNSSISVKTFAIAPESAELDIQLLNGTIVHAETMLEISSVDSIHKTLGLPKDSISNDQLVALIEKVLEQDKAVDKNSILKWANSSAIFATLAGSEPLVLVVSAIVGLASVGSKGIGKLKSLIQR